MKRISFPKIEWPSIRRRLRLKGNVWTTRVSAELGKYRKNSLYQAPWGDILKVAKKTRLTGIAKHPFRDRLTAAQKKIIVRYGTYDIIRLVLKTAKK